MAGMAMVLPVCGTSGTEGPLGDLRMNILVVRKGGREHALAWKLAAPNSVSRVFVAPGNAGTALEPARQCGAGPHGHRGLAGFAKQNDCALTVIGQKPWLRTVDHFTEQGLACLDLPPGGATRGKQVLHQGFSRRHDIPTASYAVFTEIEPALAGEIRRADRDQGRWPRRG